MRLWNLRIFIIFFLFLIVQFGAQAQQDFPFSRKTTDGRYSFLKFNTALPAQRMDAAPNTIKQVLGLGTKHLLTPDTRLRIAISNDKALTKHARYQQYFNGLKVEFGIVTAHTNNNLLESISGEYFPVSDNFSTIPSLNEALALENAMRFMGSSTYSWQDKSMREPSLSVKPSGELVICRDYSLPLTAAPVMRLAYKFALYATEPLRYEHIYVDALNGKILLNSPIIKHTDGIAATRYSGARTISTAAKANGFTLKDTVGNYNIATWDMHKGTSYSSATEILDNDNDWTQAEYDNSNFDNAALDAHWGAMMTVDYFKTKHNRNSFDNNGARINSYVHYASGYVNAFWNGSFMTYGDGNGVTSFPLTTLDICGHEIAHAICEYSAGLIYMNESGALNESLSDIWGACIEKFAAPEKNTWLLGDEISTSGTPFRSLINPNSYGQPDTYHGTLWYNGLDDNGGVHYNSGVMNHWFYILSEGKSGNNDHGVPYNVTGIGMEKAAAITYRAEILYLFPGAVYADARVVTLLAAEDLYGVGSNEYIQVAAAWNGVGVYDALLTPHTPTATLNAANNIVAGWSFTAGQTVDGFLIERAVNGSNVFVQVGSTNGLTRNFIDSNYIPNSINKYRIRSFRNGVHSGYSAVASISVGNGPFVMQAGTYTICDRTFLDPGGFEKYPQNSNLITTLVPSGAGNKLRVVFNSFRTTQYYDILRVFNGPGINSPLIGSYNGTLIAPIIESTAPGGELTFQFFTFGAFSDSGWNAHVSCFKPVTAPTNLVVSVNAQKKAVLQWIDNAPDETSYIVERSLNDSFQFTNYSMLPVNATSFTDENTPDNSIIYYRIKATRDSSSSKYSNTGYVMLGSFYTMQNGNVNTCNINFLDPGGIGTYQNYSNYTTTFTSADAGKKLKVSFAHFHLAPGADYLSVYNGPNTSSPLLGSFQGSTLPQTLLSTAPNGELTFVFYSDYAGVDAGFLATISCYIPVTAPTNLMAINSGQVTLNWNDNANDETRYVVERSVNANNMFVFAGEVAANATSFTDALAPNNSVLYYRLRAFRDSLGSTYSNTAFISYGNAPFFMKDSTVITCDKVFMDGGGAGNYQPSYIATIATLTPPIAGYKMRVEFSQFKIGPSNVINIFDGPNTGFPMIGQYSTGSPPPAIQSTSANGSLTFQFSNYGNTDSGWIAQVRCFMPVARPTGLVGTKLINDHVQLNWNDNSSDETKFIVERSVNAPSLFRFLAEVPANSNAFIDSTVPENSQVMYRVRAARDVYVSFYSDTTRLFIGNAPFLMKDSVLVTCDKIFMDPGGVDRFAAMSEFVTTFKPPLPGHRITAVFSKFSIGYRTLGVYNGPSTSSPYIGGFEFSDMPPTLTGTGPDGSLTFKLYSGTSGDSGWIAQISCYKIPDKPTGVNAVVEPSQKVKVSWNDNSSDETKFVVERSVNSNSMFVFLKEVSSNTDNFIDSSAPANSVLHYRVLAFRDTVRSSISDTGKVNFGNIPYIEHKADTTIVACEKLFMDPGGLDRSYYTGLTYNTVFKPAIPGNKIRATLITMALGGSQLNVFNGDTLHPYMRIAYYSTIDYPQRELVSTAADGALKFVHNNYQSLSDSGFIFRIFCYRPEGSPTNMAARLTNPRYVQLNWQDNSNDETGFVLERSISDTFHFTRLKDLPPNTVQFIDSSALDNVVAYYRIYAQVNDIVTDYSNKGVAQLGTAPVNMVNGTLVTCDAVFYDPNGLPHYSVNNNVTMTFVPPVPGNKMKVVFSRFRIQPLSDDDNLKIYDGPSAASPLLGRFQGSTIPPSFESSAPGGELTFVFYSNASGNDSGWVARVSCIPPKAPSNLITTRVNAKRVDLQWSDPNINEHGINLERSVSDSLHFVRVAQLPANSTSYTDTSIAFNVPNYYRVKAFNTPDSSGYSNTASAEAIACNEPLLLVNNSSSVNQFVNGYTKITDENCKLFANIQPQGISPVGGTVKSSIRIDISPTSAYGLHFVKRRFEFLPASNQNQASALVTLYVPQSEFDNYNDVTGHAKLPASPGDSLGIKNVRVFLSRGGSTNGSGLVESYSNPPEELDPLKVQTIWNSVYSCWEVRANITGFGGLFISSKNDTLKVCPVSESSTEVTLIKSNIYGSSYQWQTFNGTGFVNISDDGNHSGTQSFLLQVKTASMVNNDTYRCVVSAVNSRNFVFSNIAYWTGAASGDWTNPENWRCGSVPGSNADIVVEGGKSYYPFVATNVICRSLTIMPGASVQVKSGFNVTILK